MGLFLIGTGLLLAVLDLPLALGKVPMNLWYGVRVPAAFESPERRLAINRIGGRWLVLGGALLIVAGAAVRRVRFSEEAQILLTFAPVAVVLVCGIAALIHASKKR